MNTLIGIVFGIFLTGIGVANIVYTWRTRRLKTIATVVSSHVERVSESEVYKLNLAYTYRVHGRPFDASILDMRVLKPHAADKLSTEYPTGRNFDVYYDPKKPEDSVLENKLSFIRDIGIALAGLVVLAVVIVLEAEGEL